MSFDVTFRFISNGEIKNFNLLLIFCSTPFPTTTARSMGSDLPCKPRALAISFHMTVAPVLLSTRTLPSWTLPFLALNFTRNTGIMLPLFKTDANLFCSASIRGGSAWRIEWCILEQPFLPHLFFDLHSLVGFSSNKARETQSVVHCVLDSLLNSTISHSWTLFNSVFALTDKTRGSFSVTPLTRMDSFPFFEDLALIYVPKIEVEFGFHSLSDEIAYVLYLRNSLFFPDIGGHIFPFCDNAIWQGSYDLSQIIVHVYISKGINLTQCCEAGNNVYGKVRKGLSVIWMDFLCYLAYKCSCNYTQLSKMTFTVFTRV